jgi:predicted site-specific integrase-resolvase
MKMDVIAISDNDDDTATLTLDIDYETLKAFAKIGILKVLTDEANRVIKEHENEYSEDRSDNAA